MVVHGLLLLPALALLVPPAGYSPAPQLPRARVVAAAERADATLPPTPQLARRQTRWQRWRRHGKSAAAAAVTAAALAVPRGPARAAPLPPAAGGGGGGAPGVSREASAGHVRQRQCAQQRLAFLGMPRRKKTVVPPLPERAPRADEIDMDAFVGPKTARRFTSRKYIFSDELTYRSDLVDELEQLEEVKSDRAFERAASSATAGVIVLGGIYGTVRGLQGIEKWMKQQELKDIEIERELTGQYISVDAGDVDTSIDPLTGKNLTIVRREQPKKDANATDSAEEASTPWLLKVLGLGGAKAAGDDDFWAPTAAASSVPKKDPGTGGAGGDAGDAGAGGEGGSDGEGGGEDGGGDGLEDDTSDLDATNDLFG